MSKIRFSPNLFLEKLELDRLKKFIDDDGFRKFLLDNSLSFGLVKKQYFDTILQNEFLNGKITEGSSLTIQHQDIIAIDNAGNYIIKSATSNISVTADNNWYWVKIKHAFSPKEQGVVSIDINGNLTGDSNCRFTEVLRGQPNFPSRIKFTNSLTNTLEYDVLEVVSDNQAILDNGSFVAETGLYYKIIGTFTPASVPSDSDKDIFQYDSCTLSLELETVLNTKPSFVEGEEFFLARVKNTGASLIIQDKRTQIWQTKSNLLANNLKLTSIPLFGIEKIKFNDSKSTLDKNIIYLSWSMRSSNYSVNSNLNIVTIIGGQGGKFKTVNDFTNGDFDGYRLYTSDGSYSIIKTSIKTGGQINCYLDVLDIDKYSNDGGTTFTGNEINITPDAEEIEIICSAQEDISESQTHIDETQLSDNRFLFSINTNNPKIELLCYQDPSSYYEITYRLKHIDRYSEVFSMSSDVLFGYYTESAFDSTGDYLPIVLSNNYAQNLLAGYIVIYSSNIIVLKINDLSYSKVINKLDLGDKLGVDTVELKNSVPQFLISVGGERQYQHFVGTDLTLNADMFIILNNTKSNLTALVNGNKFFLHFEQHIDLNGFNLKIVTDFVDPTNFTLLKTFDSNDTKFISNSENGLFIRATVDDNINWILNSTNEVIVNDLKTVWTSYPIIQAKFTAFGGGLSSASGTFRYKKIGKTLFYNILFSITTTGTTSAIIVDMSDIFINNISQLFQSVAVERSSLNEAINQFCNFNSSNLTFVRFGGVNFSAQSYSVSANGSFDIQ